MTGHSGGLNEDFRDMLEALLESGAEFVVVGAHAVAAAGVVRATRDLDVLVRPSPENAERVVEALRKFGAPLSTHGVSTEDFARRGTVYQIGLPPRRIDVTTAIAAVDFEAAWAGRIEQDVEGLRLPFLGLVELVRNKRAVDRPKDRADLDLLREAGVDVDAIA